MTQATNWGVPQSGDAASERTTEKYGQRDLEALNALLSAHDGAARPGYALTGTVWRNNVTGQLLLWDGSSDFPIGKKVAAPATAASAGEPGDFADDGSYFYICTASNTWLRVAIATW